MVSYRYDKKNFNVEITESSFWAAPFEWYVSVLYTFSIIYGFSHRLQLLVSRRDGQPLTTLESSFELTSLVSIDGQSMPNITSQPDVDGIVDFVIQIPEGAEYLSITVSLDYVFQTNIFLFFIGPCPQQRKSMSILIMIILNFYFLCFYKEEWASEWCHSR